MGDVPRYGHTNELIVRVIGPIFTREVLVDGIGRNEIRHWRGAICGGIWQPVELIVTDPVFIEDAFVKRLAETN